MLVLGKNSHKKSNFHFNNDGIGTGYTSLGYHGPGGGGA